MNAISSWSIRNPVPTIVLFLSLTIAGLYGFMHLRTNNMPDIDLPTVTVTVSQPGAAPSEMEVQVAQVIENAVASLDGVDDVSTSLSEGSSVTTVEFKLRGYHLMLLLSAPLAVGARLPIELVFERAGKVEISCEVKPPGTIGEQVLHAS